MMLSHVFDVCEILFIGVSKFHEDQQILVPRERIRFESNAEVLIVIINFILLMIIKYHEITI